MLPSFERPAASLADVLTSCLASASGEPNPLGLPAARRIVVVLVDGLGAAALRERSGHARALMGALRDDVLAPFPTTTAAGIGTLCTGAAPGAHGLTGYRVLDAAHDRVVNQLNGWDGLMAPETWQPLPTVFERCSERGVTAYAIGRSQFHRSGFTRALLRGARYVDAESIEDRFRAARRILAAGGDSLSYLYVAELDKTAHAKGWRSAEWTDALERVDGELRSLERELRPGDGVLVTADHGILDVPAGSHVLYDEVPELVAAVRHRFGEPRCLQLALDPAADRGPDELAAAWREHEGGRAWVTTREEAIAAGLFGPDVSDAARSRIGDVLVAAREPVAYYEAGAEGRSMIGQHGSLTDEEREVPLALFGALRS